MSSTITAISTKPTVEFYKPSGRHLNYLELGTVRREHAEWVRFQREQGKTMKAISAEAGVSVPTLRRLLTELALTEAVEAGEMDEVIAAAQQVAA